MRHVYLQIEMNKSTQDETGGIVKGIPVAAVQPMVSINIKGGLP